MVLDSVFKTATSDDITVDYTVSYAQYFDLYPGLRPEFDNGDGDSGPLLKPVDNLRKQLGLILLPSHSVKLILTIKGVKVAAGKDAAAVPPYVALSFPPGTDHPNIQLFCYYQVLEGGLSIAPPPSDDQQEQQPEEDWIKFGPELIG